MIVFLILICEKRYKLYEYQFITISKILNQNKKFDFIFIKGDLNQEEEFIYCNNTKILTAKCGDDYHSLPSKVYHGMKYIMQTFENVEGIFKTDDDIIITNPEMFLHNIYTRRNNDYFGLKWARCRNNDNTYKGMVYPVIRPYMGGLGYYVSKKSIDIILNNKTIYDNHFFEDICTYYVLFTNNIKCTDVRKLARIMWASTPEDIIKRLNEIKSDS